MFWERFGYLHVGSCRQHLRAELIMRQRSYLPVRDWVVAVSGCDAIGDPGESPWGQKAALSEVTPPRQRCCWPARAKKKTEITKKHPCRVGIINSVGALREIEGPGVAFLSLTPSVWGGNLWTQTSGWYHSKIRRANVTFSLRISVV